MRRHETSRSLPLSASLFGFLLVPAATDVALAQETRRATLTIRAGEPGPKISRHIYGHFAEHLGRCIYDGLWVGHDSKIPNTRGIRNDIVEALRKIKIPNLRWPGGCFADQYHWQDGDRPARRSGPTRQHPLGRRRGGQRLRHPRVPRFLRADRRRSLHRGQRRQRLAAGDGGLDRIHDLPGRQRPGQAPPEERPRPALEGPLPRHRQRELGLRRPHDARVLLRPLPPFQRLRARLVRQSPGAHRRRAGRHASCSGSTSWPVASSKACRASRCTTTRSATPGRTSFPPPGSPRSGWYAVLRSASRSTSS